MTGADGEPGTRLQGPRRRGVAIAALAVALVVLAGFGLTWWIGGSDGDSSDRAEETAQETGSAADGEAASESEPEKEEPLLLAEVEYVPRRDLHTWVHPSSLSEGDVDRLNRELNEAGGIGTSEAAAVMREAGAVEAMISTVEVELEGNSDSKVEILGARAVPECQDPLDGTLFYWPVQGAYDTVPAGFDLDEANPIARSGTRNPTDGPPEFVGDFFSNRDYTLERYQQITLRFSARTFEHYCEYRYRFDLKVDGKKTHQIVDDNGEPFRVTAEILQEENGPTDCSAYDRTYYGLLLARDIEPPEGLSWLTERDAQEYACP